MRSDRLGDIMHAIENLERSKDAGEERFLQDDMMQVWVIHHLLIVGEAARGLS